MLPGRFWCDPRNFAQVELWTQPKSSRPHARGLDFGPRSTHAILRGSKIGRKCQGRADFGRGGDFFDPRNFAWVEQNLAPARFGPTLGTGQGLESRVFPLESRVFIRETYTTSLRIPLLENRISLLEAYTKVFRVPSKMFFGHNLCYMAPFAIPRPGFCMVFHRASFVFSCLGADF